MFVCFSCASKVLLISMLENQVLIETDMHWIATVLYCVNSQLITAARDGKAADVDRLIKDGVDMGAKDEVRAQFRCQCEYRLHWFSLV